MLTLKKGKHSGKTGYFVDLSRILRLRFPEVSARKIHTEVNYRGLFVVETVIAILKILKTQPYNVLNFKFKWRLIPKDFTNDNKQIFDLNRSYKHPKY